MTEPSNFLNDPNDQEKKLDSLALCANARFDVSFFGKNISQDPYPRENSLGLEIREN